MLPVNLDTRDTRQVHQRGAMYEDGITQQRFRYYKYNDGAGNRNASVGFVGAWFNVENEVTCDTVATGIARTEAVGQAQAAFRNGEWGWWQTRGSNRKEFHADSSISADSRIVMDSTSDGHVEEISGNETVDDVRVIGVTRVAATGTGTARSLTINAVFLELE